MSSGQVGKGYPEFSQKLNLLLQEIFYRGYKNFSIHQGGSVLVETIFLSRRGGFRNFINYLNELQKGLHLSLGVRNTSVFSQFWNLFFQLNCSDNLFKKGERDFFFSNRPRKNLQPLRKKSLIPLGFTSGRRFVGLEGETLWGTLHFFKGFEADFNPKAKFLLHRGWRQSHRIRIRRGKSIANSEIYQTFDNQFENWSLSPENFRSYFKANPPPHLPGSLEEGLPLLLKGEWSHNGGGSQFHLDSQKGTFHWSGETFKKLSGGGFLTLSIRIKNFQLILKPCFWITPMEAHSFQQITDFSPPSIPGMDRVMEALHLMLLGGVGNSKISLKDKFEILFKEFNPGPLGPLFWEALEEGNLAASFNKMGEFMFNFRNLGCLFQWEQMFRGGTQKK